MSDFESGCISAFESVFPDASTSTCYFHMMQSFKRNSDKAGLIPLIRSTDNSTKDFGFEFRKLR